MEFRKANKPDINRIMEIIGQAQAYFRGQGINQWQNNYPNPQVILNDINHDYSYVLTNDGRIIGTCAVSFDGEKTYNKIYNGRWLTDNPYAVVHRIAVDNEFKGSGVASETLRNIEKMCLDRGVYSIRVDTHEDNKSMQRLLEKNNYVYCGIIYLEDKSPRLAYEKVLFS